MPYKMYNTGSSSWGGYDAMLKEVFGGYTGENPMAGYVKASGATSPANTNQAGADTHQV